MHSDIFTPGTCLFIVLLCLTTNAPLTVKHIFEDNLNWAAFHLAEKDNLRDVEINEVNKILSCKTRVAASSHTSANTVESQK
jgi:hypothetical protein